MPDAPNATLEGETIRRMAAEEVKLALRPSEVDALRTTLNALLEEIGRIAPIDRAGAEPETHISVEEWPR
jgi:Asp-tRNA(Asn)/Glu-tRNA(Gln) amidotransferase C subunit